MAEITLTDIKDFLALEADLGGDDVIFSDPFSLKEVTPAQAQAPQAPSSISDSSPDLSQNEQKTSSHPAVAQVPQGLLKTKEVAAPPSADLFAKAGGWKPSRDTFDIKDFDSIDSVEAFNQKTWEHSYYAKAGGHSHLLFGHGPLKSRVLLVTTWPFAEDIELKAPFTGQDGELLSKMLKYISVETNLCYTTFLKKCSHRGNFKARELTFLKKLLAIEIELANPDFILILGNKCGQMILDSDTPFDMQGTQFANRPTFVTYHPRELSDTDKKREAMNHLNALAKNF